MNFSEATDQQLYDIAKDDKARMRDRYTAAGELQRRKQNQSISAYREVDVEKEENRWF